MQRPWDGPDPGVGGTRSSSPKVLNTNPRAACFPGPVVLMGRGIALFMGTLWPLAQSHDLGEAALPNPHFLL